MRILIGFECSGTVRDAFIARGHMAWSNDLKPAETNNHRHLQCDFEQALEHRDWDLIIMHPPCQHMAVSGNSSWANSIERAQAVKRTVAWYTAAAAVSDRVAMENPVGVLSTKWASPAQYIQPYQYGEDAAKKTGLWLKGLPRLRPTGFIEPGENGVWGNQTPSGQNKLGPSPTRAADRARTYQGIADAMANQWG